MPTNMRLRYQIVVAHKGTNPQLGLLKYILLILTTVTTHSTYQQLSPFQPS